MTIQEKTMLTDFLVKLTSVKNINKDAEADALIKQAMVYQPDAGYVLVQNMLLMQHHLTELNARVAQLENQLSNSPAPQNSGSFLGAQSQNAVKSYFSGGQPQQSQQAYAQPQYAPPQQSSGFGSFLQSAGTTAVGVAGGMFLYEGVSSLFGGSHSSSFGAPTQTTTNNYYQDQAPSNSSSSDFFGSNDIDDSFSSGSGDDLF